MKKPFKLIVFMVLGLIAIFAIAIVAQELVARKYNQMMRLELKTTIEKIQNFEASHNRLPKFLEELPQPVHKNILYESYRSGTYFLTFRTKGLRNFKEGYHYTDNKQLLPYSFNFE